MRYPGEVWFLPPEAREHGDPKMRRHVLLTTCAEDDDIGVLSYASTAAVEAAFGGATLLLDPSAHAYRHTGFTRPTYITPCRLISAGSEQMVRLMGRIIDELPDIRRELRRALGLGTGTAASSSGTGSLRGHVVVLSDALADECGALYGMVVTEHGYSAAGRYQLFIPVLDAEEFRAEPDDVVVTGEAWLRAMSPHPSTAIVATRLIQTAFQPLDVKAVLPVLGSETTLRAIDRALIEIFGL